MTTQPVRPAQASGADDASAAAGLPDDAFAYRIGTSVLTEFALGHTPADVLRELVQNEYDATGTTMHVEFGDHALTVTGNGKAIDATGWRRLSVMLGTGAVAGGSDVISKKTNGIGSKNFGLRSLFLFGDRLSVRSGGRYTVLDWKHGALPSPRDDPASAGRPGVVVNVGYRLDGRDGLPPFDADKEHQALTDIARELAPTLIKLADPAADKSVNTVSVRSRRTGADLHWQQRVRPLDSRAPGVLRTVRVTQNGSWRIPDVPGRLDEVEYHRLVRPPAELRPADIPPYYRRSGGRIMLGISLPLRRRRLDLGALGSFYYPLGATRSRTGFPFSVSAPFTMNDDRSQLVETINSAWNAWLLEQAAQFAVDLLPTELYPRHGADAYRAISPNAAAGSTAAALPAAVDRLLRHAECWPTRARSPRTNATRAAAASALLLGEDPALDAFAEDLMGESGMLAADLTADPAAASLAISSGAKVFTANSLVRLRCAGADGSALATKCPPPQSERHYRSFPEPLVSPALQTKFSNALDGAASRLSEANRGDLRTSPTTLAADGTLRAPDAMWNVPDSARAAIPAGEALHPSLAGSRVLARLCRRFDLSTWARETAESLQAGDGGEHERAALLQCVRSGAPLNARAVAAVRRAPIVTNHRGDLVAPADTVLRSARGAALVRDAVSFMPSEDENNPGFARLKPRVKLRPEDLVELARLVDSGDVAPAALGQAVVGLPRLLTAKAAKAIGAIRCLETASGLASPRDTYLPGSKAAAVLGPAARIPVGVPARVLAALGSRPDPSLADVLARLRQIRDDPGSPAPSDALYAAALDAARRERTSLKAYSDEPLIWTDGNWHAPAQCLVGGEHRSQFLDAVPVIAGASREACAAFGAPNRPQSHHWRALFAHVSERHAHRAPVPPPVRRALLRAYGRLDALPEGLPPSTRCLLDRDGALRPLSDATKRKLLRDDDPLLSAAIEAAGADVRFAEAADPATWPFWGAAGVQRLGRVARETGVAHGPSTPGPPGLHPERALARLHEPTFASAAAALAAALLGSQRAPSAAALRRRLAQRDSVHLVERIDREYALPGGVAVTVAVEHHTQDNEFVIARPRSRRDFEIILSRAVAALADPTQQAEQVLGDPLFFLLQCRSDQELQRELARRRVPWQPDRRSSWTADDDDDDEGRGDTDDASGVVAAAVRDALQRDTSRRGDPPPPGSAAPSPAPRAPAPPLPDPHDVRPRTGRAAGAGPRRGGRGGGAPPSWAPRTPAEQQADRELGRHGEMLVLREERARLVARGLPEEAAVWTADLSPGADHDIRSVGEDGQPLYIEVKATRGRDGRFSWPLAEFTLAVQQRGHYILYRVYEAGTLTPAIVPVADPVGAMNDGRLAINVETLAGDIGPVADDSDRGV